MDHDGIRRANLVERGSRRTALRAGASGLAAAFGFGALGRVAAQEATPTGAQPTELLFVQSFGAGTLAPNDGADGTYALTLSQGVGRTLYFADRPERITGIVPTAEFLEDVREVREEPPNAALVADPADRAIADEELETIWVVTLLDGVYDAEAGELTYDVRILDPAAAGATRFVATPAAAPATRQDLGPGHLFIDDIDAYHPGKPIRES